MLKYAALLFNTVAILIYQFFFADGITVSQSVPSSAKPRTEFTVELTINKGTVGGFAKLQQDLPEGFTAVQGDNNGASFTFSNQSVKFIWMSLPNDKEFKVKYKVKVAEGMSGDKTIAGKFSYVSDNVKQSVDIAPSTISIGSGSAPLASNTTPATTTNTPTNTTNPTTTSPVASNENTVATTTNNTPTTTNTTTPTETAIATNTSNNSGTTTPPVTENKTPVANETVTTTTPTSTPSEPSSITCSRNVPSSVGNDFTVEVTINKGNVSGFAKLLETLPAGFTATAGTTQGASFSFTDQKVKFVWVSMPSQTEFKVSYKVSVAAGTGGTQPIDGVFSYIENDETKKFVIPTSMVTIGGSAALATNTTNTTTNTPDNTVTTNNTTATNTNSGNTTTSVNPTNTVQNTSNNSTNNTTSNTNANSIAATTIPAPQGNVNYKVQIAALHNAVDANVLATRYNINQRIETEMAEGFTKYLVGSHNDYKNARDAREEIKNKGVAGPFVTAYNGGKRITVQEGLMISNQKWFR